MTSYLEKFSNRWRKLQKVEPVLRKVLSDREEPKKNEYILKKKFKQLEKHKKGEFIFRKKKLRGQGELIKGEAHTYKISKQLKGT